MIAHQNAWLSKRLPHRFLPLSTLSPQNNPAAAPARTLRASTMAARKPPAPASASKAAAATTLAPLRQKHARLAPKAAKRAARAAGPRPTAAQRRPGACAAPAEGAAAPGAPTLGAGPPHGLSAAYALLALFSRAAKVGTGLLVAGMWDRGELVEPLTEDDPPLEDVRFTVPTPTRTHPHPHTPAPPLPSPGRAGSPVAPRSLTRLPSVPRSPSAPFPAARRACQGHRGGAAEGRPRRARARAEPPARRVDGAGGRDAALQREGLQEVQEARGHCRPPRRASREPREPLKAACDFESADFETCDFETP